MDSLPLLCSILLLLGGGLYWFFWILRLAKINSIATEKLQDSYNKYWSFFSQPKEISNADKVLHFVDVFYSLITDVYEKIWGQSFHFSPSVRGKSHGEATRLHEEMAGDLIGVKPGHKVLDAGCGIGGPMRAIAAHSGCKIVGITINEYQVQRARMLNKKARVDSLCEVVLGNFLEMPFDDNSFDGVYSIEATCHAPMLEDVYAEIFRVLKPGALYVSYEWVTTDRYCSGNVEHEEIIRGIERGDALPGLRHYSDIAVTARKVGFEVVKEKDLAMPPAGPWWTNLETVKKIDNWINRTGATVLEALGLAPKGTLDVHVMLSATVSHLIRGGETGIFTPMHMILCRKPSPF
uniref:Methyltransferase n=1 Tax=Rauvolfia serpentina TaxID=4060 RepID=A0A1I9RGJ5_RAUSE|nr:sterol C-methyltransferase-like protein [Rauvolfia serpentina]